MYISIEASIGVGKSTLLPKLADELGLTPVQEDLSEGSDFLAALDAFNKDKTKAIDLQLTINKWRNKLAKNHMVGEYLTERSMLSDIVFAHVMVDSGYLTRGDFNLFQALAMSNVEKNPPEVVVYLACDPLVAYERMMERARPEEDKVDLQYLVDLEEAHEDLLVDFCDTLNIPFVRIDYTHFGDAAVIAEAVNRMQFLSNLQKI